MKEQFQIGHTIYRTLDDYFIKDQSKKTFDKIYKQNTTNIEVFTIHVLSNNIPDSYLHKIHTYFHKENFTYIIITL